MHTDALADHLREHARRVALSCADQLRRDLIQSEQAMTPEQRMLRALDLGRRTLAVVSQVNGKYVAYYSSRLLANGWEPYDQPGAGYMPRPFAAFDREPTEDGGVILRER